MTRSIRITRALVRAALAFLSTLVRRLPSREHEGAVSPDEPRMPSPGVENRCPVCQARFRGARICSRCGADLQPLMVLAVEAWQLRQAAQQALGAGDVQRALGLANEAQGIQGTERGEALRLLAAWLNTVGAPQ